jgi:hypothetical protein
MNGSKRISQITVLSLDGIKSTAENSFDPLLETSELSTTAIYLPSGLADGLGVATEVK